LGLCAAPVFPVWKIIQAFRGQIPPDQGLLWLGGFMIGAFFCVVGCHVLPVGLFILAGHSEIELRDGMLRARECWGPVCWRWEHSAGELRRFFVGEGLEALNLFGRLSIGPLGRLCVITPEWKPAVGAPSKTMWLAPGYPRSWLMALAHDLSRRCAAEPAAAASAQAVPVLEQEPDFSDYEEMNEPPRGSRLRIQQSADGLAIVVPPPGWRRSALWLFIGLFVWLLAYGITGNIFVDDESRGHSLEFTIFCALATWALGGFFLVKGINHALRRTAFSVAANTLIVVQAGLFGRRCRAWRAAQLADIYVMHHLGGSDAPDTFELHIEPQPDGGEALHLLAYEEVNELRWLATLLRRALHCPGQARHSPPVGLVVFSPRLVLRRRELLR
jgi:hypothetical protein